MEQKDENYKNSFSKIKVKLTFAYKHIHDTF